MNLAMLKPGEKGIITKLETIDKSGRGHGRGFGRGAGHGPPPGRGLGRGFRRRLMDMGILVGEEVTVERFAPLGDPIKIIVKNYHLALRKSEAECILVEPVK